MAEPGFEPGSPYCQAQGFLFSTPGSLPWGGGCEWVRWGSETESVWPQACSLLGQAPLPLALPSMPTSWSKANTQYPEQQPSFIYWIDQKVRLSFSHKVLWENRNKLSGHPNTLCLLILDLLVFGHQRSYRHHQRQLRKCLQMNKDECAPLEKQAETNRI